MPPNYNPPPRRPQAPYKAQFIARVLLLVIALLMICAACFGQTTERKPRYRIRAVKSDTNAAIKLYKPVPQSSRLALPEIFSPNGDGYLDEIHFGGPQYKTLLADIYNPLGMHILTFRNGQVWDGENCPMGAYIYIIQAVTLEGDTLYTSGRTILSR